MVVVVGLTTISLRSTMPVQRIEQIELPLSIKTYAWKIENAVRVFPNNGDLDTELRWWNGISIEMVRG